ncbi:acyl carrier protein, partial [bacterium]|nr:acyl carrier protein [bacterium]
MGLNAIEIIMALEDEFRIDLPDKELADVRTVGDLYEVVMAKLGRPVGDGVCMTSRVFYRLRRGLQEVTGLRRRDITPATPLAEALPAWARRRRWGTWSESAGVALPQLQLPRPLAIAVGLATLLICLGLAWSLYQADIAWYVAWPLVVVWWLPVVLVVAAVQKLASPLAVLFPTGVRTVGDLAPA